MGTNAIWGDAISGPDEIDILGFAYRVDRQHLISRSARFYPANAAQLYRLRGAHGNLRSYKLVVGLSVTSCTTRTIVLALVVDHGKMAFEVTLNLQKKRPLKLGPGPTHSTTRVLLRPSDKAQARRSRGSISKGETQSRSENSKIRRTCEVLHSSRFLALGIDAVSPGALKPTALLLFARQ